jgi:hypothetical protein
MKSLLLPGMIAALLLFISEAQGSTVFQYQSTCISGCANFGLSDLDQVNGTISFSDVAVIANASLDETDIDSFSFLFGSFSIDDISAISVYFDGILDATASSFASFSFVASDVLDSGTGNTLFFLSNDSVYPDQGRFGPGRCNGSCSPSTVFTFSGTANLSGVHSLTSVPVPPAFILFNTGLLGLFGVARNLTSGFSIIMRRGIHI